jgi:hypothetical protein
MKTTPLAQSPPSTCSDSSLSDAVKALNTTLKKHAEERTKEFEIQLLKLEVTDLELQMLTLARKLRAAKEKLISHYAAEVPQTAVDELEDGDIAERLERIQEKTGWDSTKLASEIGIARATLFRTKGGANLSKRFARKLRAVEKRVFSPQNS